MKLSTWVLGFLGAVLSVGSAIAQNVPVTETEMRTLAEQVTERVAGEPLPVQISTIPFHGVSNVVAVWWLDEVVAQISVGQMDAEEREAYHSDQARFGRVALRKIEESSRASCAEFSVSSFAWLPLQGSDEGVDFEVVVSCTDRATGMRSVMHTINIIGPDEKNFGVTALGFGAQSKSQMQTLADRARAVRLAARRIWAQDSARQPAHAVRISQDVVKVQAGKIFGGFVEESISLPANDLNNRYAVHVMGKTRGGYRFKGGIAASNPRLISSPAEEIEATKGNLSRTCPGIFDAESVERTKGNSDFDFILQLDFKCDMPRGATHGTILAGIRGAFAYEFHGLIEVSALSADGWQSEVKTLRTKLADQFVREFSRLLSTQ